MPSDRAVTILHLSDMQFGRNHIFGRLNLAPLDHSFDSLAERLRQDLRESQRLVPDLIVVSGDLTEWGMPAEFEHALEFLNRVLAEVALPRERVVIVPGNHDINRNMCLAYFAECAAKGQQPLPPFWKKWQQYRAFFDKFYKDLSPTFTIDQPWTWFELPELQLVVAGLNSTMAEIHCLPEYDPLYDELVKSEQFGHFGRAGEQQLRWFEQRLRDSEHQGWLRIGVVHHNVRRGAVDDDENLCDADDTAKQNALLVLKRLDEHAVEPLQMAGQDLSGEDLRPGCFGMSLGSAGLNRENSTTSSRPTRSAVSRSTSRCCRQCRTGGPLMIANRR